MRYQLGLISLFFVIACDGATSPQNTSSPAVVKDPWILAPSIYPSQGARSDKDHDGVTDRLDRCNSSWRDYGAAGKHRPLPQLRTGCPQVALPNSCRGDVSPPRIIYGAQSAPDGVERRLSLQVERLKRGAQPILLFSFNDDAPLLSEDQCPLQSGHLWIAARWEGGSIGTLCELDADLAQLNGKGLLNWGFKGAACALEPSLYKDVDLASFEAALQSGQIAFDAQLAISDAAGHVTRHEIAAWAWPKAACGVNISRSRLPVDEQVEVMECRPPADSSCQSRLSFGEPTWSGHPSSGPFIFAHGLLQLELPVTIEGACSQEPHKWYAQWELTKPPTAQLKTQRACKIQIQEGSTALLTCHASWSDWVVAAQDDELRATLLVSAQDNAQLLVQSHMIDFKIPEDAQ